MLLTLPLFNEVLPVPTSISLLVILALVLSAGFTSPKRQNSARFDLIVSVVGLVLFGFEAVRTYSLQDAGWMYFYLFWVDSLLSVLFFGAGYLSLKTLRGFWGTENRDF